MSLWLRYLFGFDFLHHNTLYSMFTKEVSVFLGEVWENLQFSEGELSGLKTALDHHNQVIWAAWEWN